MIGGDCGCLTDVMWQKWCPGTFEFRPQNPTASAFIANPDATWERPGYHVSLTGQENVLRWKVCSGVSTVSHQKTTQILEGIGATKPSSQLAEEGWN